MPPLASLLFVVIAGCAVGPDYRPPADAIPSTFREAPTTAGASADTLDAWWQSFDDPLLNDLIARAARQNLDIAAAGARLREARASARAVGGARYPELALAGGATRNRLSENGQIPIGRIPGVSAINTLYQAGFDASWEIDLFGSVRRRAEAAVARAHGAAAVADAARLSVAAEIAGDYFNYRGAQQKLAALDDSIALATRTRQLTQQRLDVGDVSDIDLARADSDLAALRAQRPTLATATQAAEYAIEVLLGETPGRLADTLTTAGTLPPATAAPPPGLPSALLQRRPDIVRAETDLHAATADVGVAVAAQFPQLSLVGSLGQQATGNNNLLAAASRYWSIGPSLSVPLFNGGALANQADARHAALDAALASYRKTVLAALADVETALDRDAHNRERMSDVQARFQAVDAIVAREQARYTAGDIPLTELLDAQRQRNDARSALVDAQVETCTGRVSLYKALGGGWAEMEKLALMHHGGS
jgi:NodT family efflux transporter outer membrane factor (OMF) lipoprotein